jgi:hypothetical protein
MGQIRAALAFAQRFANRVEMTEEAVIWMRMVNKFAHTLTHRVQNLVIVDNFSRMQTNERC